ncbi:MAG: GAF domain-containing sensor histidine kinase [Chthonomonadales bacterium]|nr:GAF domain-containing sensor histidine kinase [Chthonomonadales bacterium]
MDPARRADSPRASARSATAAGVAAYGVALASTAAAFAVSLLLRRFLGDTPSLLFVVAVLLSAWHGGLLPALAATALSALAINVSFAAPHDAIDLSAEGLVRLAAFVVVAVAVSSLTAARRRAADALASMNERLETRVAERTEEIERARQALERHAARQAAVARLGQSGLAGEEPGELARAAAEEATTGLRADGAEALFVDPRTGRVVLGAQAGRPRRPDGLDTPEAAEALAALGEGAAARAPGDAALPGWLDEAGMGTGLWVPLRGARVHGCLGVYRADAAPLDDAETAFLEALANVVATAADRLAADAAIRGQAIALVETTTALAAEPDLEGYLGTALDACAAQLEPCSATLWLAEGGALAEAPAAARVAAAGDRQAPHGAGDRGAEVARQRALLLAAWGRAREADRPFALTADDVGEGGLVVPMRIGENLLGAICVAPAPGRTYRREETDLAQALAQQATLAVHMARLNRRGREAAVLEERNRMAREIHDTLAQGLTGILLQLEAAEEAVADDPRETGRRIGRARELARESLAGARRSVWALRPRALERSGLAEALARLVATASHGARLRVTFAESGSRRELPPDVEDDLLRIAQEALSNALRHAGATTVRLELRYETAGTVLRVRDDGRGFDAERAGGGSRFGLVGMRERARRIGADFQLRTAPGNGAEIAVRVPLAREREG